jgi:hypothetical protein
MSEFYDFLGSLGYKPHAVSRMNLRHRHIIEPWRNEIEGSRVLDLGSHDGRWGYAFAAAGAASVLGIEGRAELAAQYASLPDSPFKDKVQLVIGDFVTEMDHLIAEKACFDIVACLGVYYHTMEHYRMMLQMASFKPRLIIIDSVFSQAECAVIEIDQEETNWRMNAIAQLPEQNMVPIGRPSLSAVEMMAESVGYTMTDQIWDVPENRRATVADYYNKFPDRRRHTVVLAARS